MCAVEAPARASGTSTCPRPSRTPGTRRRRVRKTRSMRSLVRRSTRAVQHRNRRPDVDGAHARERRVAGGDPLARPTSPTATTLRSHRRTLRPKHPEYAGRELADIAPEVLLGAQPPVLFDECRWRRSCGTSCVTKSTTSVGRLVDSLCPAHRLPLTMPSVTQVQAGTGCCGCGR
jgi:hypothetical protein